MRFFYILLFFALPLALFAQKTDKATIRGNVFDKADAQPISFATVQLEGTTLGANTDINGFFTMNVPVGTYQLVVSYLGYEDYKVSITLKKGDVQYQNISIVQSDRTLGEVVISGKKEQARSEVQVSKLSVTPKQIRALPSAGGQPDIAQYLTVLPGVIFTGDQGGQLYIRGGSPVQNRILLDGMTIYNPFHSIGFFSVFETELIRNVDVLTGGFNADYGGRISAIVDVKTREGNRKRLSGLVSASPFQAKAIIEGPIIPLKKDGGSSLSFVVTAKKGLINQTDQYLYKKVNNGTGIPFDYQDLYGKLSFVGGNGSKFNFFGFNYDDAVVTDLIDFSWTSNGGGMDFSVIPQNSNTIVSGTLTYSGYKSKSVEADRQPRSSSINGYFAGINFTNYASRNDEVKYGIELNGFTTDFVFRNFLGFDIPQKENTTEIAGFVRWKRKIGNLVIEPGFRMQYYQTLSEASPEPRIGLKYNISNKIRFKAAGGLYSQNLLSTVNERDIVNLFVGFLSGPESTIYKLGEDPNNPAAKKVDHRLQKAWHSVGGFEFDLLDNVDLNVEGYYKDFTQLLALNRNKTALTQPDYVVETGKAYGVDVSGKFEGKRSYVWLSYSLGYVKRNDGQQIYPPVFDRRHNMNVVATYLAGKKKEWDIGLRWNLGSGFPFTQTQGFYTNYNFNNGISTDVYGGNQGDATLGIVYSDVRNGGRLPYYHRMDVSVKRTFKFGKHGQIEIVASATNVYDRPNIFYFDRVRYARVNQLPILPSISTTIQW